MIITRSKINIFECFLGLNLLTFYWLSICTHKKYLQNFFASWQGIGPLWAPQPQYSFIFYLFGESQTLHNDLLKKVLKAVKQSLDLLILPFFCCFLQMRRFESKCVSFIWSLCDQIRADLNCLSSSCISGQLVTRDFTLKSVYHCHADTATSRARPGLFLNLEPTRLLTNEYEPSSIP